MGGTMGVVTRLFTLDPEQAAHAAMALPTVQRLRIERTDADLFPDPLVVRTLLATDPVLPAIGDDFDPVAWGLPEALGKRGAVYVVDDVVKSAFVESGELVIEHAIGVKRATWLDEAA
jgi:hypothetical protein